LEVTSDGQTCSGFKPTQPQTTQTGHREWQCSAIWSEFNRTSSFINLSKFLLVSNKLFNFGPIKPLLGAKSFEKNFIIKSPAKMRKVT
jgi:hypothetical protein